MPRTKQVSDEALLAAAREVFVAQGYGGSTRAIARRAGVSEAVLYQRHRTKLDLFFAAMVPPPFEVTRLVAREGRAPDVPRELESIALAVMAYFRGVMPMLMQLVTHPAFSLDELTARHADMPVVGLHAAVAGHLRRWRRARAVGVGPRAIDVAVLTLVAALHSLALFERLGVHGGAMTDELVRGVARVVASSLQPAASRRTRGGRRPGTGLRTRGGRRPGTGLRTQGGRP
jgi:AcrR family transcriptional regulator